MTPAMVASNSSDEPINTFSLTNALQEFDAGDAGHGVRFLLQMLFKSLTPVTPAMVASNSSDEPVNTFSLTNALQEFDAGDAGHGGVKVLG